MYAPLFQVVNLLENRVCRILGKVENNERFLRLALYQGGKAAKRTKKLASLTSLNSQDAKAPTLDPTVVACAFKKHRFYLFRWVGDSDFKSI